jgi:5-methylcytosine-specific restriction endonuclease McrA
VRGSCAACGATTYKGRSACTRCRLLRTPPHAVDCLRCGIVFRVARRGPRSDMCRPCRKRAWRAARGEWAPTGEIRRCRKCGADFTVQRRRQQFCMRACGELWQRVARRGIQPGSYRRNEIGHRDGWRCHLCAGPIDPQLSGLAMDGPQLDHLVPIARGGTDESGNVAIAHRRCNSARGARLLTEIEWVNGAVRQLQSA